jgi:tetratricopeptide (TPR) repeat protein
MGERQRALDYYEQALPMARLVNDRVAIATVLNNMGEAYRMEGDHHKALTYYNQAIDIVRSTKDRQKESSTLGNIAKEERALGNSVEARTHVEQALAILESLRANVTNSDLRASFFVKAQGYFEFYIDLLMQLHKLHPKEGLDIAALQASERGRARSLMETLIEARANIREGVDPQLLASERSLQQQLNAQGLLYRKLAAIPNTEEQVARVSNEIRVINTQYQEVETKIRQVSPRYSARH